MKYKSLIFSCMISCAGLISTNALAGGAVGGDCCADLEERVAKLEATTVRKGNRKVTLSVVGSVHRAVLISEPGSINDYGKKVMITDTYSNQTNVGLVGLAAINRDLFVGYTIILRIADGGNLQDGFQQDKPVDTYLNDLTLGSRKYGTISIGYGNTASDLSAEVDLSGTGYTAGGSTAHYNIGANLDGFDVQERVKFETGSIAGFRLSASWQENQNWDAAVRYAGKLGDFKIMGKIAYFKLGEDVTSAFTIPFVQNFDSQKGDSGVTGSISVLHNPTGLSFTFAKGEVDSVAVTSEFNYTSAYTYFKAGYQRKFLSAGKTYFSADFHETETIFGDVEKFGVQLVQDIDAAAMQVYLSYWDADQKNDLTGGQVNLNERGLLIGAKINF